MVGYARLGELQGFFGIVGLNSHNLGPNSCNLSWSTMILRWSTIRLKNRLRDYGRLRNRCDPWTKGRGARCRLREFQANVAYFLPALVGHNHFVNTKFTRPAPEICRSTRLADSGERGREGRSRLLNEFRSSVVATVASERELVPR